MQWRLLTKEEIAKEYPRAPNIAAAAGLMNDEGELYSDTHIVLHGDRTLTLPPTEVALDILLEILDGLTHAHELRERELAAACPRESSARA